MNLIVDASVAVKWVAEEPGSEKARDLVGSGDRLLAPDLVLAEAGNALRKKLARGIIDRVQAIIGVQIVERAFDELFPARPLVHAAIGLAFDLDHPVYDCIYLALAARENLSVVTADERLFRVARNARIEARLL
jgi:predicted nucleic acid-binding protein